MGRRVGILLGALLLAIAATAVVGMATAGDGAAINPWLRPPTFAAESGPGTIRISDATEGDPYLSARWIVVDDRISLAGGPAGIIGPGGTIELAGLEAGDWLVATENTIHWTVEVPAADPAVPRSR